MFDLDRFWNVRDGADDEDRDAGATEEAMRDWEREHGVSLPALLREVLSIRDGGTLRDAPVTIRPLDAIRPVGPDFWQHAEYAEEVDDRSLVFEFAEHAEVDLGFLLDYNARGRHGEPSVFSYTHGDIVVDLVADDFREFVAAQVETDEHPDVDWDETVDADGVLGREVVETTSWGGAESTLEQVLLRRGDGLIFYTRRREADSEILTKTTLPGPIVAQLATIRAYQPPPNASLALHLQTDQPDGVVYVASSRSGDGGWKNSETHGAPIYIAYESADRGRLEALRAEILGPHAQAPETRPTPRAGGREDGSPTQTVDDVVAWIESVEQGNDHEAPRVDEWTWIKMANKLGWELQREQAAAPSPRAAFLRETLERLARLAGRSTENQNILRLIRAFLDPPDAPIDGE